MPMEDCLKSCCFLFIFVVISPNIPSAAASAISAQTVQTDVPLRHVMSRPLKRGEATPWQVVQDPAFKFCKHSWEP